MAATFGKIGVFSPSLESWSSYSERLAYFFSANNVEDEKKHDIFLTVCGPQTFQLLRSLCQPRNLRDVPYDELLATLSKHYDPAPSPIVQRYKFHTQERGTTETVAAYVAQLKNIARHCNFPADTMNEMIRDRLVCGVNDSRIQRALLQEPNLTYEKALEIAQGIEAAAVDVQTLNPNPAKIQVLQQRGKTKNQCYRCGGNHSQFTCRFKDETCRGCGKKGHIQRVCRSKAATPQNKVKPQSKHHNPTQSLSAVERPASKPLPSLDSPALNEEIYQMYTLNESSVKPLLIDVEFQGSPVQMEVDTGAALSLISEATFRKITTPHSQSQLEPSDAILTTYTGQPLTVLGIMKFDVKYQSQVVKSLPVIVVKGNGPNLFGRDWLTKIRLDWHNFVYQIVPSLSLDSLLQKYSPVFHDNLGHLKEVKAKILVPASATPRFFRPRPVTYFLREKVEKELERLQKDGIIEPVQFSDWAAPIVPVLKSDGQSVRICGDYKVTINREAKLDIYPLPRIEDLFANLSGGQFFSKLDLNSAYQQIELDEASKKFTTINTSRGLFQYNRLPFGIASAPSIFQRAMETLLRDIPGVSVYLDDILVSGRNIQDHLINLQNVLDRLQSAGLTLKREKCAFALESVEYLGHIIDRNGLRPSPNKLKAINEVPEPSNISELKSFVGLLNYYHKFICNLSSLLFPFFRLMKKDAPWKWTAVEKEAFHKAKQALNSSSLLVHFDPSKEIILAADASPYGVGGVLSHKMEDGTERPIAFTSRSLTAAEKKYAQIEKEGLAIVFAVKRFHQFLQGREFKIYSDHKPLKYIFDENRQIPVLASARIQRWALLLAAYKYTIHHRPGTQMGHVDALSRLPLPQESFTVPVPGEHKVLLQHLNETVKIITADQVKSWTDKDPLLSRVRHLVLSGWCNEDEDANSQLKPYLNRRSELSVLNGCVLWGSRVVVPTEGRSTILAELHQMHPGASKMKALARCFVWWPQIDNEIEHHVRSCSICQENRNSPPRAPLHPWEWPHRPWARIHIDHAGPFMGHLYLIVVDAHSKWMEVVIVSSTSSEVTIKSLQKIFATHGYPEQIVSDNASGFTSTEFKNFTQSQGILHTFVSPYHPASNGMAERCVQILKNGLKMLEGPIEQRLTKFLLQYRITPQTSTGLSPSELLMGRRLRNRLTLLHPDTGKRVQVQQEKWHTTKIQQRDFAVGEKVYIKSFNASLPVWIPATVEVKTGPVSYKLKTSGGLLVRRHLNHVRRRVGEPLEECEEEDWFPRIFTKDSSPAIVAPPNEILPSEPPALPPAANPTVTPTTVRRSNRTRKPVDRFAPFFSQ